MGAGHEFVRTVVRDMLADRVPAVLAAHLAEIAQTAPDPASVRYTLGDSLQLAWELPVVMVRATDMSPLRRTGARTSPWLARYTVQVLVAAEVDDDPETASHVRDRLLLAVRRALIHPGPLPAGVDPPVIGAEATGAVAETLRGRLLTGGTVTMTMTVAESHAAAAPGAHPVRLDSDVVAHDASEAI
jgi:hypothetical protein